MRPSHVHAHVFTYADPVAEDDKGTVSTPKKKSTPRKGKKDAPAPAAAADAPHDEDDAEGDIKAEPAADDEI